MGKQPDINPGQLTIPSYTAELVPPQIYPDLKPYSRVALVSLIEKLNPSLNFGSEPSFRAYRQAEVSFIERGLYIPANSQLTEGHNMEHVVYLSANTRHRVPAADPLKTNVGVAFQPVEFKVIARNAHDLGRHVVVKTRNARWGEPDREAVSAAAKRSAGHALASKILAMDSLAAQLKSDSEVFRHLIKHLVDPSKVRVRVKRLEAERALGVEKIHDTVEVAGIYTGSSNSELAGQHRVVKRRIYSGNYSHAERTAHLVGYLRMTGLYNHAKLYKIGLSKKMSQDELDTEYQAYIDEREARELVQPVA